ncbi:MAG TPA: efflux RND transporter periplasmic adaptor subunit [Kofleriaceae bacterium]|nr:efflux RND transporter periplasmic adaptor subunit [Kofleriaceae bacterium]
MQCRVLVVVALASCGGSGAPHRPPPAMPVPVVTLAPTPQLDTTEYLAELRSRTAPAIKPQIEGQVTAILVKPGQIVQAGTPLVHVDPGRQPSAVQQARENRASRQAALELAEQNYARVEQLVKDGALPGQELDNARAAVDQARADVAALTAEIRGSQVQLEYYAILAPTRGVVGDIPVRVGDHVSPATTITSVTDNSVLEANVSIPIERAGHVGIGTEIRLVDDSGKTLGAGHVKFVAPDVTPDTQSVLVKADIDNALNLLRADQIVRARVVWSRHPGLAVPAPAVMWQGGQPFVFVVQQARGQTIARQHPVELGELGDGSYPVVAGLQAGERVITGNIQKLRDGTPVAVRG